MKTIRIILGVLQYALYLCLLGNKSMEYQRAKIKGMRCIGSKTYPTHTIYKFDPSRPPQDNPVMSWSKFRIMHNF